MTRQPRSGDPIVELRDVRKDYGSLRPLRIARFALRSGETVAILGVDQASAQTLVDLITAATLPDAGEVLTFGASTRTIGDPETWFRSLDRFGIVSERAVLVDELTVEQNLALPLTLEIQEMPPDLRRQVGKIADEVGIPLSERPAPMVAASSVTRIRVRLGRALALDPQLLLAEHPNAAVPPDEVARLGGDLAAIAARRGLAMLVLTADPAFASAACGQIHELRPATGDLRRRARWRRWFTGRAR